VKEEIVAFVKAKGLLLDFFYWPWLQALVKEGHVFDMAEVYQEIYKQVLLLDVPAPSQLLLPCLCVG
jgi:hypothetical protein